MITITRCRIPSRAQRARYWFRTHLTGNPDPMPRSEWFAAVGMFLLAPTVLMLAVVWHELMAP